jgi:hypothetical protein
MSTGKRRLFRRSGVYQLRGTLADLSLPIRKVRNAPPGKHFRGFREFRTRRRSNRDEPERLALPQWLVGIVK